MGVKDLWQLLSPTGRRVSIETLAGKVRGVRMFNLLIMWLMRSTCTWM